VVSVPIDVGGCMDRNRESGGVRGNYSEPRQLVAGNTKEGCLRLVRIRIHFLRRSFVGAARYESDECYSENGCDTRTPFSVGHTRG